ncbi:MAG: DNA replication/repair protein RecF [Actinobacteria bacterium]|nr:DNA replication/repair protein RecF [Actinomycetota bacterium]
MYIKALHLKNYRNYSDYCVDLKEGLNLVIGENAIGKTNLLESIYFLENGRSHRTSNYQELIKWKDGFSTIKASIRRMERDLLVEAKILKAGGKQIMVNGVVQKNLRGKIRPVCTVIFTPDHLKIVKDVPECRRSYIDEILEKIKANYSYWRQQYVKILRQRNVLLKNVHIGRMKGDIIDYWDKQIIGVGARIIFARKSIIEKLEETAKEAYKKITDTDSTLLLRYENQLLLEGDSVESLERRYAKELEKKRGVEIERGQTVIGPHRDDLGLYVKGVDIRTFGSQGEQRSTALALKLAEFSAMTDSIKEQPILLLDDVMSELDETRRRALMSSINNGTQTIITSTNIEYFGESDVSMANIIRIGQ